MSPRPTCASTRTTSPGALLALLVLLVALLAAVGTASAATFTVDSTLDRVDASPGDGACATSGGLCTLRAAVQEANALAGADTVQVPAGTFTLAVPPATGEAEDGDLDVTAPLVIDGAGPTATIVDGADLDRLLEIHPTAGYVTVKDMTLRNGTSAEDGGGVHTATPGTLRLDSVRVSGNVSELEGGGVYVATGSLAVIGTSRITGNTARGGGGVYAAGEPAATGVPGRITLTGTVVADNRSESAGGGLLIDGEASLIASDTDLTGNATSGYGAGLAVTGRAGLTVTRGTISGKRAEGDGAGVYTATERSASFTNVTVTDNHAGVPVPPEAGDGIGGAMVLGGSGSVSVTGGSVTGNSASSGGGGIAIESIGSVTVTGTAIRRNTSGAGAGGILNEGNRVTLTRLDIRDNRAAEDGGGILGEGSGPLTVEHSMIVGNRAANGGGFANAADGTTRISSTTFWDNRATFVAGAEESGLGGGVYSLGDAGTTYENITVTGNFAQARGGGIYTDADAGIRVSHATIVGNSAPIASGVGGEIGSVNSPVQPSQGVIFRNSIISGNLLGENCSFALGSRPSTARRP